MAPHWLLHLLGLDSANGTPYLALSGIIGNLGIFGGIAMYAKHRTCKVPGCWRLGHVRHGAGQSNLLCHVHHAQALKDAPAADPAAELLAHVDALGQAVVASTEATARQTEVLADLAEAVRASLATRTHHPEPPRERT